MKMNRIRPGGNFAWGPSADCGSLPSPRDTNRSGPTPHLLPETYFVSTIRQSPVRRSATGCGIPALDGDLVFGDAKTAQLWHANLTSDRQIDTRVGARS